MPSIVRTLILSPLILLLISATRLLLISNYDTTSALGVAAAGGVAGTLLGSVLPIIPPYLPLLVIGAAIWRKWGTLVIGLLAAAFVSPAYAGLASAYTATLSNSLTFWEQLWDHQWTSLWFQTREASICAVLGVVVAFSYAGGAKDDWGLAWIFKTVGRLLSGLVLTGIAVVMVFFMQTAYRVPFDFDHFSEIARRPWLPTEEITLNDGVMRIGYTVGTKDGWFVVLDERSRSIEYVAASKVVSRRVCSVKPTETTLPFIPLRGSSITPAHVCGASK